MSDIEVGNFLEHFGIRGMKWGFRNKRPPIGGSRRPNRINAINRSLARHPVRTKLGIAAGLGVASVGVGLLMKKLGAQKMSVVAPPGEDLFSPGNVFGNPQSQALIDEMKNWRVVSGTLTKATANGRVQLKY